jgi:hypothetical protein
MQRDASQLSLMQSNAMQLQRKITMQQYMIRSSVAGAAAFSLCGTRTVIIN